MIELTASVFVPNDEEVRGIIRDKDSNYKTRFLEKLAREIAEKLMRTPGAVQVTEVRRADLRATQLTAKIFIATEDEARGRRVTATEVKKAQYDSMMDAMRLTMPMYEIKPYPIDPEPGASKYNPGAIFEPWTGGSAAANQPETLTLDMLEKLQKRLRESEPNPIDFLKQRLDISQARKDGIESSKARIRADREIKDKTKRREPQITVKVRRIQMPEEAKG